MVIQVLMRAILLGRADLCLKLFQPFSLLSPDLSVMKKLGLKLDQGGASWGLFRFLQVLLQ